MKKSKKGAALIYTLVIILFLSALAVSLLMVASGSRIATSRYNNLNKIRLISESGIEKGIAKLKEKVALNPNVDLTISSSDNFQFKDNNVTCTVSYFYKDGDRSKILIESDAVYGNLKKKISVTLNKTTSFTNNNYVNNLTQNAITVMDDTNKSDYSFKTSGSSNMDIYGSMYVQGSNVTIVPRNLYIDGDLKVKANSFTAGESNLIYNVFTPFIKGKISVDAEDIDVGANSLGVLSYFAPTQNPTAIKTSLKTINMLEVNPSKAINTVEKESELAILVTKYTSFANINNIFKSNKVSQNTYKIVMVHGDLDINVNGDFSNYIIYCDGKVTVNLPSQERDVSLLGGLLHFNIKSRGVVTFTNSTITSKQMEIKGNSYLVIKKMKDSDIDSILPNINNKIIDNLNNYYESLNVEIIEWKE